MDRTEEIKTTGMGVIEGYDDCIEGIVDAPEEAPRVCYNIKKLIRAMRRNNRNFDYDELAEELSDPVLSMPCFIRYQDLDEPCRERTIFRKFPEGDVIALFPGTSWDCYSNTDCMSYMHTGQHGPASVQLIKELERPDDSEIEELKKEYGTLYSTLLVDMEGEE